MHRLLLLGLNHTTAPLAVRERLAFDAGQRRAAIDAFRQRFPSCEAVLLSTCNRVELYAARESHGQPTAKDMAAFLAAFHGIAPQQFDEHLYQKTERAVVEHLFAVTASLDSMVLGETQIIGQVRDAYDVSRELTAAGGVLNPLFQRALAVGKQVMTDTSLGEGRMSVASVAVDYAKRIFETFNDKTVLCIGAGKMASLVLQSFIGLKPRRLLVCNRDRAKADALAARFGGQSVPFENLADHLVAADIVVSGTGSAQPIITRRQFDALRRQRRYRPIFLIDIAVPRDVEAGVGDLENVYLYNVDDLQQVVKGTQDQRSGAIEAAQRIVARHVDEFLSWHRQREMGPLIDRLYKRSHQMAQDEVARTLGKLPGATEAERGQVEELARRIVNKLLNGPVQTLRNSAPASPHTGGPPYLHALERLFDLNEPTSPAAPPLDPPEGKSHGQDTAE